MNTRWMVIPSEPPAHLFTPASAGRASTLCGQYSVTIDLAHWWQEATRGDPHCSDCDTLAKLEGLLP